MCEGCGTGANRDDSAVEAVHARHKLVQRLCEIVALLRVQTETAQDLLFASVLEFIPVVEAVEVGKELALRWVTQIRQLVLTSLGT